MTTLRTFLMDLGPAGLAAGGLLIGMLFGAMAQRTHFCAMGAVSDMVTFGDSRRFRAWALAAAVAILGTHALSVSGAVDLSRSLYLAPRLNWLGHIAGGALFGFGMVLAGGCTSRNLVRAGAGDLRSGLTLLVVALAAGMTMGGLAGPLRKSLEDATAIALTGPTQSVADITGLTSLSPHALPLGLAGIILFLVLECPKFRASRGHWISGLAAGLLVVAGWAMTGLAFDEMADRPQIPASLSFVKPTVDSIDWLERMTALGWPGFGAALVFGVLAGSYLAARLTGQVRLQTFANARDTARHLTGAAMMGVGGVMGLGCSVGQGITGLSTLALGSFLSTAAIITGAIGGLRALERLEL